MAKRTTDRNNAAVKPFEDLTFKVIGCAMQVHNQLGPGLKEAIYQRALSQELQVAGLAYEEERAREIELDGVPIGLLYVDHLVEERLIVEEKAFSHLLTNEEVAQVITYLCALELDVGLLINFGRRRLEYKRIFPPKDVTRWRERIRRYVWNPATTPSDDPFTSSVDR